MRFWIEMSTPKEVLFFKDFIPEILERGHDYFITTRKYEEANDLIDHFNLKAHIVGGHGGKSLYGKLASGAERIKLLSDIVGDADVLVNLCNPEACRVAFGLGIPVINFIDMPESDKVCRLTVPLSKAVFTPFHVPKSMIRKYWDGPIKTYNCLDPIAWMSKEPKPLDKIWNEEITYPFIIYRPGETKAAYYPDKDDITIPIVEKLMEKYPSGTFLPVPRYEQHKMVDMQNLLYYADLFIGGGGTMNIEAAYWGTWTVACRPVITTYDRWMEDNVLQVRANTIEDGVNLSQQMIKRGVKNKNSYKLRNMTFPLKEIITSIEEYIMS